MLWVCEFFLLSPLPLFPYAGKRRAFLEISTCKGQRRIIEVNEPECESWQSGSCLLHYPGWRIWVAVRKSVLWYGNNALCLYLPKNLHSLNCKRKVNRGRRQYSLQLNTYITQYFHDINYYWLHIFKTKNKLILNKIRQIITPLT